MELSLINSLIVIETTDKLMAYLYYYLDMLKQQLPEYQYHQYDITQMHDILYVLQENSLLQQYDYVEIHITKKVKMEQILQIISKRLFNKSVVIVDYKKNSIKHNKKLIINYLTGKKIITDYCKQYNIQLTGDICSMLANNYYNSPTDMMQTLQLLTINHHSTTLAMTDIILNSNNFTIFQLSDNYLCSNLKKSIYILQKLLIEKNYSLICWVILTDLNRILHIKNTVQKRGDLDKVLQECNIWKTKTNLYIKKAKSMKYKIIIDLIKQTSNIDFYIKGIIKGDINHLFIILVINICNNVCLH